MMSQKLNRSYVFAGTFITEWEDGFQKCSTLLSDITLIEDVVNQMVNIAIHHSMDGWLINIENKIKVSSQVLTILFEWRSCN